MAIRPNGERPALHVPGASRELRLTDIDLEWVRCCHALLLGGPDALAGSRRMTSPPWWPRPRVPALTVIDVLARGTSGVAVTVGADGCMPGGCAAAWQE